MEKETRLWELVDHYPLGDEKGAYPMPVNPVRRLCAYEE
jgi:hypothetical protein